MKMSQQKVTSYFTVRKRLGSEELHNKKSKKIRLDASDDKKTLLLDDLATESNDLACPSSRKIVIKCDDADKSTKRRSCLKRIRESKSSEGSQPKNVRFTLAGPLSPKKKIQSLAEKKLANLFENLDDVLIKETGMRTPTKEEQEARAKAEEAKKTGQKLSISEIKSKIIKSSRLSELKESLNKLHAMEEVRQKSIKLNGNLTGNFERDRVLPNRLQMVNGSKFESEKNLKQFDTIELEVLSSPQKGLCTPTKPLLPSVKDNELMSPKKTATPRRLFSPTKASPSKAIPAYQRFQSLIETGRPTLQLPYKYRCLAEMFKSVDTVCSMFFNRRETITMKKLKPAVQRMLRKNFSETILAQINYLYPEAYKFHQKKMLNPGSHTKYDYYQLVITPNVAECNETITQEVNADNIIRSGQQKSMNPQTMIERQQHFHNLLLDLVKAEHDKFLLNLNPPMHIDREKVTRWHPDFDLQSCPDIGKTELPLPPNIEKFSSAKDILSTARNLFNCATPTERMMERYDAKQKLDKSNDTVEQIVHDPVATVLKGVPKSLLERIRARQAAKVLDNMTRRPSQDRETNNYARLPDLARHIRNIFVTESKSVLDLESVLTKLANSYRERIARDDMKNLLHLLAKETPMNWLTFHHIRKTDFVKINKSQNLTEIINQLELKADAKR